MLQRLLKLFKGVEKTKPRRRIRRVVYRLMYPEKSAGSKSGRAVSNSVGNSVGNGMGRGVGRGVGSDVSGDTGNIEIEETQEIKEDINKAIKHLIEAGKNVYCPFCRAKVVHLVDYFLRYHYKTLLAESGVPRDKLDEIFEERYENMVRRKVEEVKKVLKVGDYELKETAKDLVKELFA